jgi:hypothetical protein
MTTIQRSYSLILLIATLTCITACAARGSRDRIPSEVETAVASIGDDLAEERYDKLYSESSSHWKKDSTPERSAEILKELRTKLGKVENRSVHTAIEQQNSGGQLQGHAFIITYETRFERGKGMETFTLIEEDKQWKLARYLVNSTDLK